MSGSGVGEMPNAAFAALSAQVLRADGSQGGLSSSISESQEHLDCSDNKSFTESLDRRCRALDSQGLSKPGKITLTNVAMFKPGDNVDKWMGTIWTQILLHQGGASLQQCFHKVNYMDNSLQPLPSVMHTAVHRFTPRDADTATLKAMLERGELIGTPAESFFPSRLCTLGISDKVKVLVEMLTEIEGENKDEWIDRQATIVKVEDSRHLMHSKVRPSEESTRWFPSTCVRRAACPFSYSMPRHGSLPHDNKSTARQVGPIID